MRAVVLVACLSAPAFAQPSGRVTAAEHFNRGQTAQADGRYRDAITSYEQAYALVPHADTLYNIAVCYEALEEWDQAATYFERYLDGNPGASDAAAVRAQIRTLRAKTATPGDPWQPPAVPPPGNGNAIVGVAPPVVPPPPKWHFGASYGLGFGDTPVQRVQGYGGIHIGDKLDVQGVIGLFGKNDQAIGVIGRLKLGAIPPMRPFLRSALTIGLAKTDDSSTASTKFPIGLEAGGGLQLGKTGWLEVAAVVRFVSAGVGAGDTMADSFVNDSFAFAIDVGIAFDVPLRLPASFANARR